MAKRSRQQVEIDEKKVMRELQIHAKDSIDELAKRCKFSGPKVRRIIKNLEDSQTIWGYHAVTDYEKVGLREFILLIKKTTKPMDDVAEQIISRNIEEKAKELDIMIGSSFYLNGAYDWILCFTGRDLRHAKKFEGEVIKMYKDNIQETQILENIFTVKRSSILNPSLDKLRDFI